MSTLSPYSTHFFDESSNNSSWSNMYPYIADGSRVLDVGCSTGNFGAALEKLKGCTVVGVDLNAADVAEAAKRISEAFVLDITVEGVAEKLGTFDVVVFADVIEHLPDPRATLRAVHSLLNPGGRVVYSIPHMGHLSVRTDMLEGRFPYTEIGLLDRTHLHFYDRGEINDVFRAGGFRIVEENPIDLGYPAEWTSERLGRLGLTTSPAFFEMLRQTEANVYQYVGLAVPATDAPAVPSGPREQLSTPDEYLAHAGRVIAENKRLQRELDELRARLRSILRNPIGSIPREIRSLLSRRKGQSADDSTG